MLLIALFFPFLRVFLFAEQKWKTRIQKRLDLMLPMTRHISLP